MTTNLLNSKNFTSTRNISKFINLYAKNDNWHGIDKATGNLGYGWIHYGIIRNLEPKRVLVIGSRYGFIPAVCAMACRDNKKGKVDFVDAGYDQASPKDNKLLGGKENRHWGGVGFWNKVDTKKHFGAFGLNKYIQTHVNTSNEFRKKYFNRKWDYVYLDGEHSYKGVKSDFKRFWSSVTKSGILSLHDLFTKNSGELKYGVGQLWRELKREGKYNCLEIPGKCGLGIIQK